MKLNLATITGENAKWWEEKGYILPQFDVKKAAENAKENPKWVHFGAGNIFRAFIASVQQDMLNQGLDDTGLVAVSGFNYELLEKVYREHDNVTLLVTLKADGNVDKKVIGSVGDSAIMDRARAEEFGKLEEIFKKDSLQMISFTITEKGYALKDADGNYKESVLREFEGGPDKSEGYMGKIASLCYIRYLSGQKPLALVSMDNFSHNGDKLKEAVVTFAKEWEKRGFVDAGYIEYLENPEKIAFPWSMIDKITPRPDDAVAKLLSADGFEGADEIMVSKNTHAAPFVNAEEPQYLVIEDKFPAGRPELEKAGIIFTDKDTVDKVEKMKVCTCLNPLHTALAVFGCVLGFEKISDEMNDEDLKQLVYKIGYKEGLPVVVNPGIINPEDFIREVLEVRIPNPFMPDTPQRIATDTSQKLPIRFGETIKAYAASDELNVDDLTLIPLVFAGWLRYLMAVNDNGEAFDLSSDPLLDAVCPAVAGFKLGEKADMETIDAALAPVLKNATIFGVDLYEAGMAEKVCGYFAEMIEGVGAVRKTLQKYI